MARHRVVLVKRLGDAPVAAGEQEVERIDLAVQQRLGAALAGDEERAELRFAAVGLGCRRSPAKLQRLHRRESSAAFGEQTVGGEEVQPMLDQAGIARPHPAARHDLVGAPCLARATEQAERHQRLGHRRRAAALGVREVGDESMQLRRHLGGGLLHGQRYQRAVAPRRGGRVQERTLLHRPAGDVDDEAGVRRHRRDRCGFADEGMLPQRRFDLGCLRLRRDAGGHRRPFRIGRKALARFVPGVLIAGEAEQQRAIGGEHLVEQAGGEKLLDGIPAQIQAAALLVDLMIEPDLRRLADAVDDGPDVVDRFETGQGPRQRAGEYHRHGKGAAASAARQLV